MVWSDQEINRIVAPLLGNHSHGEAEKIQLDGKAEFIDLDQQGECVRIRDRIENREGVNTVVRAYRDDHGYRILPGKLHSVVKRIENEGWKIVGILVFYTDRAPIESGSKKKPNKKIEHLTQMYWDEPVGTGPILARALAEKFRECNLRNNPQEGIDFENYEVCHVNLLKGLYAQEGNAIIQENPRLDYYEYPIALQVVRCLDDAVNALAHKFAGEAVAAIVSHTGGMGDIKACLTPSARFRFGGKLTEHHDSEFFHDDLRSAESEPDSKKIPRRSEALDAKFHAEQRIWEGDFHGAWAVVSHLQVDDSHDPWVRAVQQAAHYMEGFAPVDLSQFPGLHEEITWDQFYPVLRAAFRVEAALQNNKGQPMIADALRALMNFWEVFEYELIYQSIERKHSIKVDRSTQLFEISDPCLQRKWKQFLDPKHKEPFKVNYRYPQPKKFALHLIEESQTSNKTEQKNAIEDFDKLIYGERDANGQPQSGFNQYRNTVTHYVLTRKTLAEVKNQASRKQLWKIDPNQQQLENLGHCFLETDKVRALFKAFHGIHPAEKYRCFVKALFANIRAPVFIPAQSSTPPRSG